MLQDLTATVPDISAYLQVFFRTRNMKTRYICRCAVRQILSADQIEEHEMDRHVARVGTKYWT
jgi:hypothetical protein